jgi:hypothetical protein
MPIFSPLAYIGIGVVGFFVIKRALNRTSIEPLPPGPPGLPIVGNIFDWPKDEAWRTFAEWSHKYGK